MEIISPIAENYVEKFSNVPDVFLQQILNDTYANHPHAHMVSGAVQGKFLQMISLMVKPLKVLEIGTFTGYSALCLAEGLHPEGKLITIDNHAEQAAIAQEFFDRSIYKEQIKIIVGKAMDVLNYLNYEFDLVFIDADKINYSHYFDLVIDKVKSGGYILADNVLYNAEVLEKNNAGKNAKAMHQYNEKMSLDTRLENVLLPLRDGIMISRKK